MTTKVKFKFPQGMQATSEDTLKDIFIQFTISKGVIASAAGFELRENNTVGIIEIREKGIARKFRDYLKSENWEVL